MEVNLNTGNNFFNKVQKEENNLFTQTNPDIVVEKPTSEAEHLNDLDSTILEDTAYQKIDNKNLQLELKINKLESELQKLNAQMVIAKEFSDIAQMRELIKHKRRVESKLDSLNSQYQELGLGNKLSNKFSNAVNFTSQANSNFFTKVKEFLAVNFFSKISKNFSKKYDLKNSLSKLSNINESVNELVSMQIPYGETIKRYEKLTVCLNRANVIHSRISKNY